MEPPLTSKLSPDGTQQHHVTVSMV